MFIGEIVDINECGHLEMLGWDLVEMAREYGTPLYVYNEEHMRNRCRQYLSSMQDNYPHGRVIYAGKAFLNLAMCRLVFQEGLYLDVVSGGELYTALQAGFPAGKIYFHGNNKTEDEINMALERGVGILVVDSLMELEYLIETTKAKNIDLDIMLRVKPGVTGDTHKYIQTGQVDSKFGLGIDDEQALKAVKKILDHPNLKFRGLHCHIGSQIFQARSYQLAAEVMIKFMTDIKQTTGAVVEELNLGGGLGIRHTSQDAFLPIEEFVATLAQTVRSKCEEYGLPLPVMSLEPGRSIAGEAGITLYQIGTVKEIPETRTYVSVDGGMMDNLRPALYGAIYEASLANRAREKSNSAVTIAGKACESGDILIKDAQLPYPSKGDILTVYSTGAYHFSMFSQYNRVRRPALIFIRRDGIEEVVRRESYEDMIRLETIPSHLRESEEAKEGGCT